MASFLPDDSPLYNPPSDLHPKQKVAIDGIRLALDMLHESWRVLCQELERISLASLARKERPFTRAQLTSVYMKAWVVIDVLHRLGALLTALPGLERVPEVELAIRSFAKVEELRHGFQHVDQRLAEAVEHDRPLWGSVSWIWHPPETVGVKCRAFTLVIGSLRNEQKAPMLNPCGKEQSVPLGLVTVDAFGHSVDLSMQIDRVIRIGRYLDAALKQAPNPQGGMADALFSVDITYGSKGGAASK